MAKETTKDPNANRTRWGGIFLALSVLLVLVSFSLFMTLGQPAADAQQRAQAIAANAGTVQLSGYVGAFGDALIAAGAFFLVTRAVPSRRNVPVSAFWLFVAIGHLVFLGVDAFAAQGMVPVAQAYATTPALFVAAEATVNVLVGIAMLAVGFGLLVAFWGEAESEQRVVPKAVSYVGVLGSVLALLAALGPLTGIREVEVLFFGVYLLLVPLLLLAVRIAWPAAGVGRPAPRIARA